MFLSKSICLQIYRLVHAAVDNMVRFELVLFSIDINFYALELLARAAAISALALFLISKEDLKNRNFDMEYGWQCC